VRDDRLYRPLDTLLSSDLTKAPLAQFTKTRVLRTVVVGRTVYQAVQ
jgi:predicted amidohydrolase YtcJ